MRIILKLFKSMLKFFLIAVIVIITINIILANMIMSLTSQAKGNQSETITKMINRKYPSYEIVDIDLEYVDALSNYKSADDSHSATRATVIIQNKADQMTIKLYKNLFMWHIGSAFPNYGPNVPNGEYYVEISGHTVGNAVNIEEYMKDEWIIPKEDGSYYEIFGDKNSTDWYYSVNECKAIYKTKDGDVYEFNKSKEGWDKSIKTYSDLCTLGNYKKVSKEYVIEIFERYTSYIEE